MKFKSRIDIPYVIWLAVILVLYNSVPVYSIITAEHQFSDYVVVFSLFAISMLMIVGTKQMNYKIKNGILIVKGSFVNETIPIDRIHSIKYQTKAIPNFKSSTARTGLLVKYQTHYSIFITPKHQEKFIQELLNVNDHIVLTNYHDLESLKSKNITSS